MKGRYAALALMLLCMLLPAYGRADVREQIEAHRDTSVLVEVPGRGRMKLYPQTNPRYAYMKFEYKESRTRRDFDEGGCAPCAAAMALSTLKEARDMLLLNEHTANGKPFSICVHAVNAWDCDVCTERMNIVTEADMETYLPVVLGAYACGNNDLGIRWRRASRSVGGSGGVNAAFLAEAAALLGLKYQLLEDHPNAAWLDRIGPDAAAVCLSVSSPFTGGGHYVTVVATDEKYMYILDPLAENRYDEEDDPMHILQVMEPGLVRVRRDLYRFLGFYTVHIVSR